MPSGSSGRDLPSRLWGCPKCNSAGPAQRIGPPHRLHRDRQAASSAGVHLSRLGGGTGGGGPNLRFWPVMGGGTGSTGAFGVSVASGSALLAAADGDVAQRFRSNPTGRGRRWSLAVLGVFIMQAFVMKSSNRSEETRGCIRRSRGPTRDQAPFAADSAPPLRGLPASSLGPRTHTSGHPPPGCADACD